MAIIDGPFGFRPIESWGGPYTGTLLECAVPGGDTTDTFIGDFVSLDGSSTTAGTLGATKTGIPTVIQATGGTGTTTPIFGCIVSFAHDPTNLESNYALGSAANDRICYVCVATKDKLFIGQEDGLTDTLDQDDVGSRAAFTVGTGNATYGTSAMEINSNTASASATEQLLLVRMYQDPDNVLFGGEAAKTDVTGGTIWVVQVSEWQGDTGLLAVGA